MRFRPRGYDYVAQAVDELAEFRHGSIGGGVGVGVGLGGGGGNCGSNFVSGGGYVLGNGRSIPHHHHPPPSRRRRGRQRPDSASVASGALLVVDAGSDGMTGVESAGDGTDRNTNTAAESRNDATATADGQLSALTAADGNDGDNGSLHMDADGGVNRSNNDCCSDDEADEDCTPYVVDAFDLIGVDNGRALRELLVEAGQYLKWPLRPFPCEGTEEAMAEFRRIVTSSSRRDGSSTPSFVPNPPWLQALARRGEEGGEVRGDGGTGVDNIPSSIWAGLYPDVTPGTDFAATMDLLSSRRTSTGTSTSMVDSKNSQNDAASDTNDGDNELATMNNVFHPVPDHGRHNHAAAAGSCSGKGNDDSVFMDDIVLHLPEPSPYIRQDPDLPMAAGGTKKDGEDDVAGRSVPSILPAVEKMVAFRRLGLRPSREAAGDRSNTSSPDSVRDFDEIVHTGPSLKPPFTQAPKHIRAVDDVIEEYDADLDDKDEDEDEDGDSTAPTCFSQAWLKGSKRKWKMQRAVRGSNRIVEEQRLLPLRSLGLLSEASAFLDNRIRIDADVPTPDSGPSPHERAQASADAFSRDVFDQIKECAAPLSFIDSDRNIKYKYEIEQSRDPRSAFVGAVSTAPKEIRPPCPLTIKLSVMEANQTFSAPTYPPKDCSYLPPSFIRGDLPLPTEDDSSPYPPGPTKDKITFPEMTFTVKASLSRTMPSRKNRRGRAQSQQKSPARRSLEDIVSTARVTGTRSVGQILLSRCSDVGGLLIPQRPFPVVAVDAVAARTETAEAGASVAVGDDAADLATSVRAFLATNDEKEQAIADRAILREGNGYESYAYFVDNQHPLSDATVHTMDEAKKRFRNRAWLRAREEGAREMLLTGCKMRRVRGICVYKGFLSGMTTPPQFYELRYLAMVKANRSAQKHALQGSSNSHSSMPSILVPPSTSPRIPLDSPCTAFEAVLRIFHRSLARFAIEGSYQKAEGKPTPVDPQHLLLRTRRHPKLRSERRGRKTESDRGAVKRKKGTNNRTRDANEDVRSLSFHDVFVAKKRQNMKFISGTTSSADDSRKLLPNMLSTIDCIERLGRQAVSVRGELSHLLNKSSEIAKEEDAYWREMAIVGGTRRVTTTSRLAFSPHGPPAEGDNTDNLAFVSAGEDPTGDKGNVQEESSVSLDPSMTTPPQKTSGEVIKDAVETQEERKERKRLRKERRREKKERKRQKKRERKQEKKARRRKKEREEATPHSAEDVSQLHAPPKKIKPNEPESKDPKSTAPFASASKTPSDTLLGPTSNAAAAMRLGFTPKPPSASRFPRLPDNGGRAVGDSNFYGGQGMNGSGGGGGSGTEQVGADPLPNPSSQGFQDARVIDYSNRSRILEFPPSLSNSGGEPRETAAPKNIPLCFDGGITPFAKRPISRAMRSRGAGMDQGHQYRPSSNQTRPLLQNLSNQGQEHSAFQGAFARPQSNANHVDGAVSGQAISRYDGGRLQQNRLSPEVDGVGPYSTPAAAPVSLHQQIQQQKKKREQQQNQQPAQQPTNNCQSYGMPIAAANIAAADASAETTDRHPQGDKDQPMRSLCSGAFFEMCPAAVTDLTTGQWANGLQETDEESQGRHELAGAGWGQSHTLASQKSSAENAQAIALYDNSIIEKNGVDIELPNKAAIVAVKLSSWCCHSHGQGSIRDAAPPQEARDLIRRLVMVAATGRYLLLHVLLCVDTDLTPAVSNGVAMLQNALIRQPGCPCDTTFQYVSPRTLSTSVAELMLEAYESQTSSASALGRDDKWIEDVSENTDLLQRVRFLQNLASSLTAYEAFEIARSPRPFGRILSDLAQGGSRESGQELPAHAFQISLAMRASATGDEYGY